MLDYIEYNRLKFAVTLNIPSIYVVTALDGNFWYYDENSEITSYNRDFIFYNINVNHIEYLKNTANIENGNILETLLIQELKEKYLDLKSRNNIKVDIDKQLKLDKARFEILSKFKLFLEEQCLDQISFTIGSSKIQNARIKITCDENSIRSLHDSFDKIRIDDKCKAAFYNFNGSVIIKCFKDYIIKHNISCLDKEIVLYYNSKFIKVKQNNNITIEFIESSNQAVDDVVKEIGRIIGCDVTNYNLSVFHSKSFELYNCPLILDVFKFIIVNDNFLSDYFFMKECNNIMRRKTISVFSRFYNTVFFSINVSRPQVLVLTIKNCSSVEQLDGIFNIVLKIIQYSIRFNANILKYLNNYMVKPIQQPNQQSFVKNNTLRLVNPNMFISHYTRLCPNPPIIISDDEANLLPSDMVMKFPIYGESEPKCYTCKHEKYSFIGLKENTLGNKRQYPFLPCCFFKSQMNKQSSAYNRYIGKIPVNIKRQSVDISISMKTLAPKKIGMLPQNISEFLLSESGKNYSRCGTFTDENSIYEAIIMALGVKFKTFNELKEKVDELIARTTSINVVNSIEEYLNINIFTFVYDVEYATCTLLQNFKTIHYAKHIRPFSVMVLYHKFKNAKENRYELILDYTQASKIQKSERISCLEKSTCHLMQKLFYIDCKINGAVAPYKTNSYRDTNRALSDNSGALSDNSGALSDNSGALSDNSGALSDNSDLKDYSKEFIDEFGFTRMVFHEGNNAWVETNHNIKTLNRQIATPVITNNYNLKLDDFIFLKRLSRCLFATSVHHMVHLGVMDFWKYHTIVDENIEYRIPDDCSYASHYKVFVRTQFLVFKSHELREKIRFNISLMSLDEKRMFEKEFNHIYYDEITDFKICDGEKICSIEKYKSTMINKTPNYCCILKLPCEVHIDTLYVLDKSSFDEYHGKFVKFSPMVESSNKNLSIILIRDNKIK